MKIAFIVSKFPCYDEAFILRELHALSQMKEIVIFSLKPSNDKVIHDEAKALLPKTVYTPYVFSWKLLRTHFEFFFSKPHRYVRALFRLIFGNLKSPQFLIRNLAFFPKSILIAKLMEEKEIEHMHAYWATYPASVALTISELTGIPYSFTGHAHDIYLDTTQLDLKMLRAEFVSTCTQQNKEYLRKIAPRYPSNQIWVNYHGLDLEKFSMNGKKRNPTFEILSVGTLNAHKGFNYFLDALAILKTSRKATPSPLPLPLQKGERIGEEDKSEISFHATIVGGGPLESELKGQVKELGLEKFVTMTGALKQSQVIPYYKQADLLVLMAQGEWHWGIPNVLIEALAAKTAVITTRFGSVEELVQDGKTGLLVSAKDAQALAQAIERLYSDDAFRTQLVEAGHRFVIENFNIEKNIQEFAKGFSE
ncbi:MAG: glycosyltransferase family 4 protein [Candidatus Omnitrophica bacterium]|nr:glycosyltransferase family 4 protein [Candidatus Omnitrophota bacterium]